MSRSAQKGFTLVELLVVIGIIATLGAIAIPNVARFVAPAEAAADDSEFGRVQAAMDMYIAVQTPPSPMVPENTVASNNFASSNPVLYPDFMREPSTRCAYTWTDTGQMTQVSCP